MEQASLGASANPGPGWMDRLRKSVDRVRRAHYALQRLLLRARRPKIYRLLFQSAEREADESIQLGKWFSLDCSASFLRNLLRFANPELRSWAVRSFACATFSQKLQRVILESDLADDWAANPWLLPQEILCLLSHDKLTETGLRTICQRTGAMHSELLLEVARHPRATSEIWEDIIDQGQGHDLGLHLVPIACQKGAFWVQLLTEKTRDPVVALELLERTSGSLRDEVLFRLIQLSPSLVVDRWDNLVADGTITNKQLVKLLLSTHKEIRLKAIASLSPEPHPN